MMRDQEQDHDQGEREAIEGEARPAPPPPPPASAIEDAAPEPSAPTGPAHRVTLTDGTDWCNDIGNAQRLIALHGADLRYAGEQGAWYCYDGRRWARDRGAAELRAQETACSMLHDAEAERDPIAKVCAALAELGDTEGAEERKRKLAALEAMITWARKSQSAERIAAMLRMAQPRAPVKVSDLDADPWLLNVQNGTLDLRAGKLRPHRRADRISKLCPVAYDPAARCPRWLRFLEEVHPKEDVRGFLRRLVGYSITGTVGEHVLPINQGGGRNGKGVFMNTLIKVLGDYAAPVPPELLMVKRGDGHPTERADLFGLRFASAQETEEDRELNVALVKQLTGGDPIKARRMREDFWSFNPTHKLWLSTQHRPRIKETKNAIWERVFLIPWEVEIPRERRDPHLETRLVAEEAPGILAWCVEASLEYQRIGLAPPPSVVAASQAYRAEQDILGPFLDERCTLGPEERITRKALRATYDEWAEGAGAERLSADMLAERLRERGFSECKMRGEGGASERGWRGLRLKTRGERIAEADAAEREWAQQTGAAAAE